MSTLRPHRILLMQDMARKEEGRAASAITPGMLISPNSSGLYVPHPTAGANTARLFAEEDALQGKTIDQAYGANDLVQIAVCAPGAVVFAWLAGGESVTPADFLSSNGDGMFQKATGSDGVIAQPLESMDLTGTDDDDTRIRIRLL